MALADGHVKVIQALAARGKNYLILNNLERINSTEEIDQAVHKSAKQEYAHGRRCISNWRRCVLVSRWWKAYAVSVMEDIERR